MVDDQMDKDVSVYLYQQVLNVLKHNAGFYIPEVSLRVVAYETIIDAVFLFKMTVSHTSEDAMCVYNLIACERLKWTHQDASKEVMEAFKILNSAPGSPEQGEQEALTRGGCLVVSLLQQTLVRLFLKKLMNLMTTEAVILYRNKIPSSYLENYLKNQAHFSLKEVITKYHTALKAIPE